MHNCEKAHPGKSHRRRNRALRRVLEPLRWFDDPRAANGEWGSGLRRRAVMTVAPSMAAAATVAGSSKTPEPMRDSRVTAYSPSVLRQLGAGTKARVTQFIRNLLAS